MWVKFLKTYAGKLGMFVIGQKIDLPDDIAVKLQKQNFCVPCVPPWEENLDKVAMQRAELKAKANDTAAWAGICRDMAVKTAAFADRLTLIAEEKQNQMDIADAAAKNAVEAAKKSRTEKATKHAAGVVREAERKDLGHQKAMGEWSAAVADANLKRMAAEDAESKAKSAAEELENFEKKNAKPKAKITDKNAGTNTAEGNQPVAG